MGQGIRLRILDWLFLRKGLDWSIKKVGGQRSWQRKLEGGKFGRFRRIGNWDIFQWVEIGGNYHLRFTL